MNIENQTILITGGASGFGKVLCQSLSRLCKDIVVFDIKPLDYAEDNVHFYQCDVTDFDELQTKIQSVFESFHVSVLINNAGQIHSEPLINFLSKIDRKHSLKNWDKMLQLNLSSVFYVTVNVVEQMAMKRIKGLIINISSISSAGNPGQTVYSAAKAGVNALTSTWGQELAMFGIRTAGIAPGFFNTDSTHKALSQGIIDKVKKEIPLRKLGLVDDLVKAVQFIIENDYYNAKVLQLDGGLSM